MEVKRTRRATRPIPAAVWEQLWWSVIELSKTGRVVVGSDSLGDGGIVWRRHGLTARWMVACALRFSEMARLTIADINHDAIYVTRSKRGKSGLVPVGMGLISDTMRWRSEAFRDPPSKLLASRNGSALDNNAFNRDFCGPLGLAFGCQLSSHCFRDTACQLAYSQTSSIRSVQAMLGHASVQTTEHYLAKQRAQAFRLQLPGG